MSEYLQAIATILSLINPAICAAIFTKIEAGRPLSAQTGDATKAMVAVLLILSIAAMIGTAILRAFGVSLDAFQVAGGAVLVWMGFSMLKGSDSKPSQADAAASDETPVLTPLILFAASPGTITGVITLSATHAPDRFPITSLVAVGVAAVATWLALLLSARFSGQDGKQSLVHDVVTRFMGLIVLAMGVQFALGGVRAFMAAGG